MATPVPYSPTYNVEPIVQGEHVSINTPGAAFGENVGAALKQLGGTVEQSGNEIFQRATAMQELRDQAEARNGQMDFAQQSAQLQAQFDALEGKASADQLQQHINDLKTLRTNIRAGLGSPYSQEQFDSDSMPYTQRLIFSSAGRAGEQFKSYTIGTAQAIADYTSRNSINPEDDGEFDSKLNSIDSAGQTIAGAKDWSAPELEDWKLKQKSNAWANRIVTLADTNSLAALNMARENKTAMTAQDYYKVINHVYSQIRATGSKVEGDQIYGDGTKTLDQMFKEVPDHIPDELQGDQRTAFIHDTESYLRAKVIFDRSAIAQQQNNAKDQVWSTIMHSNPTSVQQLAALPGMKAAINALSPSEQKDIPNWINQWFTKKDYITNQVEFNRLRGEAINDPQAFLAEDPAKWKVSSNDLVTLLRIRAATTKNEQVDPYVQKALGFMQRNYGSQLTALGIYHRADNPDEYDHYVGALAEGINAWMETHNGKPPVGNEMLEIGKDVLKIRQQPGMFGFYTTYGPFGSNQPFYDVPQDVLDDVTTDVKRSVPDAKPDEIYRAAQRQMFLKLYGRPATTTQPPTVPINE